MTRIPVTELAAPLDEVRSMVSACMQCGTCSASCPFAEHMDMTPRRMWRLTLLGRAEDVFASRTFWLCANCYACTLRCPRGLPLTRAMNTLKRAAGALGHPALRARGAFYRAFMDNVRRRGRVREMELMTRYLLGRGPREALSFAPLGMKLMRRGKLGHAAGAGGYDGVLGPLFAKAAEIEARSEARKEVRS